MLYPLRQYFSKLGKKKKKGLWIIKAACGKYRLLGIPNLTLWNLHFEPALVQETLGASTFKMFNIEELLKT